MPSLYMIRFLVGFRFSRGSVQTILPPPRYRRAGRLCTSLGETIAEMVKEAAEIEQTNKERNLRGQKLAGERKKLEYEKFSLKVKY